MRRDGVEPNEITYTALIAGCAAHGYVRYAYRLFRSMESLEMESLRCDRSVVTYNALIAGLCRPVTRHAQGQATAPPLWLDENDRRASLGEDDEYYNDDVDDQYDDDMWSPWAMSVAEREDHAKRLRVALSLVAEMRRKGIAPDTTTINSVLLGLTSAQPPRLREATAIFTQVTRAPVRSLTPQSHINPRVSP
jgi:pentatricopeptide repeat protein